MRPARPVGITPKVLREGPIPLGAHGLVEYGLGALLIVAPFLFGFDSDAAVAVGIVGGVLVIVFAAVSDTPTGLVRRVPAVVHVAVDYALAAALIAVPFVADFSDEGGPTGFFIALGIAHLLVTIGTRFKPARERAR